MDEHDQLQAELLKLYDAEPPTFEDTLSSTPMYAQLEPEALRYRDRHPLAAGGMKEISTVFDPKVGRTVALATLRPDAPKELFEPFLREAFLTAQLDHPNVITIYDIGLDLGSRPYFTMELKTGQTLQPLIESNVPTITGLDQLLDIFLKVCDAIDYAHSRNVLHLDLKPANIQVGQHGEVIVCDWGLGKVIGDKDVSDPEFENMLLNPDLINALTLQGRIKGTPGYMAPEQVDADGTTTVQTDVYALGAILYAMITGKLPVEGDTVDDVLHNTQIGQLVHPAEAPDSLASVAMKALSTNPAARYASVAELREDVRRYQTGFSTSSETSGFVKELKLLYHRNTLLCNVCIIFTLLLSTALTVAIGSLQQSLAAKARVADEIEMRKQAERDASPEYYAKALAAMVSGNHVAAIEQAQLAAASEGNASDAHNLLALLHFMEGQYADAQTAFAEPMGPVYRSLKELNSLYLQGTYTAEAETAGVRELLHLCKLAEPNSILTTLYFHWLKHPNRDYRAYAAKMLTLPVEDSARVLRFAKTVTEEDLREVIVQRVIRTMLYNEDNQRWRQRRPAVALATALTDDDSVREQLASLLPKNLAAGRPVRATGQNIRNLESVVDGDPKAYSCWSAYPCPAVVVVDLEDVFEIDEIHVYFRQDDNHSIAYAYTIETSLDGQAYSLLVDRSKKRGRAVAFRHRKLGNHPARFVRLTVLENSQGLGVHVSEIEVYQAPQIDDAE